MHVLVLDPYHKILLREDWQATVMNDKIKENYAAFSF